jgi:phosphatidylinositol alpha-1,6-mannosyltransferase
VFSRPPVRVDFIFPKFKLLSGAERLILSLARALAERGHHVRVLCQQFHPTCRPLADGLTVHETGLRLDWTGNHYLDSALSYLLAFRLRRLIGVDTQVVCLFGPALVLAWRRTGAHRILYFCYEPPRAAGIDAPDVLGRVGRWQWVLAPALRLYRFADRWLVGRVDAVLVNGEFGRERVAAEYGRKSSPITHGVSLVDGPDRDEARRRLALAPSARVALTVNFLHPRKRVDLLLRAWRDVERRLADAELLVVGDGPEAARLRAQAAELALSRVRFCGFVSEADLAAYYRASDLLVHVARQETFGLTVLEAAAFGLPVVAVDEGGPRYTIRQGESGLRVAASPPDIAEAIVALMNDPQRARAMGARGRELVSSRFSWARGAEEFVSVCEALGIEG